MTQFILSGWLEFRNGDPKFRQKKMRVIAKAVGAARHVDNLARPDRINHNRIRIRGASNQHQDADIPSVAHLPSETTHQLKVIAPIDSGL